MTESKKPKESEKRPKKPRALMPKPLSESEERKKEGKKKSERLSKSGERNKEEKKDGEKSSEIEIIVRYSSLKPEIQCASCGVPLATKGHVKFNCPGCSTEIIGRCRRCRINSVPYRCQKNEDCNFEGP